MAKTPTTAPVDPSVLHSREAGKGARVNRIRSYAPAAIAVAAVLLAPLVAGAALAVVTASQSPLESAKRTAPLIGMVESAEVTDDVQVSIAVVFAATPVAVVASSGVVTAVGFAAGDEITTGTRLVSIDDRDVIAYASNAPLYRDLARGAKGRDVSTAQTLLAELGFNPGPATGTIGTQTERAIAAFNAAHGYGTRNSVLSLATLSWIGAEPVTVAVVRAIAGSIVGPGSVLFDGVAAATAIKVTEPPGFTSDSPLTLAVGDLEAAYDAGSGVISDETGVGGIAAIIGSATDRLGTLRRSEPIVVGAVPASAVVTDRSGATCLFSDVTGDPIVVEALGGTLGTVEIDAELIGRPVLLNPRDARSDLSCTVS
jgi:peptidoglycan hydrolase-like protein with peptidoglycan-binding domain